MSTSTHPVSPEEIMASLDGELSADRAQFVSAHSETCADCQAIIGSLRTVSRQVSKWQIEPPSLHFEKQAPQTEPEKGQSAKVLLTGFTQTSRSRVIGWTVAVATGAFLLMAISVPNLLRSRMAANEAVSVGSLRTINSAAETYREKYGRYPSSLKSLGPSANGQPSENGADLIDPALARGEKSGYHYSYSAPLNAEGYSVDAEPVEAGSTGKRRFSTDQTGVLSADNAPVDGENFEPDMKSRLKHQAVEVPRSGLNLPATRAELPMSSGPQMGKGYKGWLVAKGEGKVDPSAPMIARSVTLSIVAKDFNSARASLEAILIRHNGYAANLNASTPQSSARSIEASLRVPAPQLAAALADLKSLGRVELENQSGEEVTQQHADLSARLKNSRETEQRLQAILTQRTGKISDVLEVEQEIARVRGEIEQMEAQQKNLEHRVDFATIDLKLSEEYKAKLDAPAASISTQIHNAAVNGYRNVVDTLLWFVLFIAEYGPVLFFWLLVLAVPAWLVRRRLRHATAI